MSFSASIHATGLEYAGSNLNTLFAQRLNVLSPRFLTMVYDIIKFNRVAKLLADAPTDEVMSIDTFIGLNRLGNAFCNDYLLPMAAAIWSCPPDQMRHFPAQSLVRFFNNHGLLNIKNRPQWRTVEGGSQCYVDKLLADFNGTVIVNNAVTRINRHEGSIHLHLTDESVLSCDHIVIATHADEALALLAQPSSQQSEILGAFRYQSNDTYLHTDIRLMPTLRNVWSCWNYIAHANEQSRPCVSVTYWMNALQGLTCQQQYFVSLNPASPPATDNIIKRIHYTHPVFDQAAMQAQKRLGQLQGENNTWFAGSYFGYGFHEDALASAVSVAKAFDITIPWEAP